MFELLISICPPTSIPFTIILPIIPFNCFIVLSIVSLALPSEAQQSLCTFRWWQPVHSGYGFDVWALDDVSITNSIFNTICRDLSNENETSHSIDIHLGNHKAYCGRHNTLR